MDGNAMISKEAAFTVVLTVLALWGCAQEKTYHDFTNQSRNTDVLMTDYATCHMSVGSPKVEYSGRGAGYGLMAAGTAMINRENAIDMCLASLGWERR